jgi:hypothetical protein
VSAVNGKTSVAAKEAARWHITQTSNGKQKKGFRPAAEQPQLARFEVEDVHNDVGSAIQQNDVSPDQHMRAIGWRGRKTPLEFFRAGLEALLEPRRQSATARELFFQPGRQLLPLGKAWRKIALVAVVPFPQVAVMVLVKMFSLVVIIPVFIVAFSVSVSLGKRNAVREQENTECAGEHPSGQFHCSLQSKCVVEVDFKKQRRGSDGIWRFPLICLNLA